MTWPCWTSHITKEGEMPFFLFLFLFLTALGLVKFSAVTLFTLFCWANVTDKRQSRIESHVMKGKSRVKRAEARRSKAQFWQTRAKTNTL